MKPETIMIDSIKYVREDCVKQPDIVGDVVIVVLQRSWNLVGRLERNGNDCVLRNASVITSWGTSKGLGEIAKDGPTSKTKLHKTNGVVQFDYLTVVMTIACEESKWKSEL